MNIHSHPSDESKKRIAVVGSGISGLSAAWLLSQNHDVTVYEKDMRIGGHANTVDIEVNGRSLAVDTGFIVYNERNYPNLTALFDHIGVPTVDSCMSFSASLDGGKLEYGTSSVYGFFGQSWNFARPRLWKMVMELLRMYRNSTKYIDRTDLEVKPLGDFLREEGYTKAFQRDHLLPMCAAIWSCPVQQVESYPVLAFLRFFENHGLMTLSGRPQWKTVNGGSREYVNRLISPYADKIRVGVGAERIERGVNQVIVRDTQGGQDVFDDVVLAVHGDQALRLLSDPSQEEASCLSSFRYQDNSAYLHTDQRFMPQSKKAWSSWNYLGSTKDGAGDALCVSYWMNRLQRLGTNTPIFVTLNPTELPHEDQTYAHFDYEHPVFDAAAIQAQKRIWQLQGQRNTWFCGAHFGSGFHEDGLQAGLAVAEKLGGAKRPWNVDNESGRIFLDTLTSQDESVQLAHAS